jgi:hypothetical protein
MWQRREVVIGGALTLLFGSAQKCFCFDSRAPHSRGCNLHADDVNSVYPHGTSTGISDEDSIIPNSGDKAFDFALAQTLYMLTQKYGVRPGFAYFDDSASPNAYATPVARLANADGTVLMGKALLGTLRRMPEAPDVAVAGVCAHEFGHILQFRYGLMEKVNSGQPTVKRSELQADFFAGYFSGLRKREKQSFPAAVVSMTIHGFGDTEFHNPTHHGTPEERARSVILGFESASSGKSLSEAIEESTNYVLSQ